VQSTGSLDRLGLSDENRSFCHTLDAMDNEPSDAVFICNPNIPTDLDRLTQQAIAQVLTPIFDPTFSAASF
jgi:hypothetical protein